MRWLVDEMFPVATADELEDRGHDARAVAAELRGLADGEILDVAVAEERVVITENVADFAALLRARIASGAAVAPVVFALKSTLASTPGALARGLAQRLDEWAGTHPDPAATAYWL